MPVPRDGRLVIGVEAGAAGIQPGRRWAEAKCGVWAANSWARESTSGLDAPQRTCWNHGCFPQELVSELERKAGPPSELWPRRSRPQPCR